MPATSSYLVLSVAGLVSSSPPLAQAERIELVASAAPLWHSSRYPLLSQLAL